jgi:uncharacterized membrane protein
MNAIRSRRERVIQMLWFEALGLAIVGPFSAHFAGALMGASLGHPLIAYHSKP